MRVLALLSGFFLTLAACADQASEAAPFQAGQHYIVLGEPVATRDPNKIEVVEIFAYTCGHCFNFEPLMRSWKQDQAEDVQVVHMPAIWNRQMEPYARAFYTAQALDIFDRVHLPIFQALHVERKNLRSAEDFAALFAGYGADEEAAVNTFGSFGVTSQVNQAAARARGYRTEGTPELVVNGKYRISSTLDGVSGHGQMLEIASFLVDKERAARSQ